jgi:hypothetical protein
MIAISRLGRAVKPVQNSFSPQLSLSLVPFPYRLNRNGGTAPLFDAFSSRELVSTSLENAPMHFIQEISGEEGAIKTTLS